MSRVRQLVSAFMGFEHDARVYLLTTLVSGISLGLFWINFNLYLASVGIDRPTIGLIATAGSIAGIVVSFPASALSDRFGRRLVMLVATGLASIALVGLLAAKTEWHFFLLSGAYGAGIQMLFVVQAPFLTERSREGNRTELFSLQYATAVGTNILAAALGSVIAAWLGSTSGIPADSPDTHRVLIAVQLALMLVALGTVFLIRDDRRGRPPAERALGPGLLARVGIVVEDRATLFRLVLPSFLISIGAGQLIPFLNLFVQRKFGLDLASVNGVFAVMSLGTVVAILAQPLLARRLGKVGSVVIVQAASIPFLVVLGFSPILWTVVVAMAVRSSLMNAGNPIFSAFAMEQVPASGRATLSAVLSLEFSLGWAIGGPWYSLLQDRLGFDAGYALNFLTIIVLYATATVLFWHWFGRAERRGPERGVAPSEAGAATYSEP